MVEIPFQVNYKLRYKFLNAYLCIYVVFEQFVKEFIHFFGNSVSYLKLSIFQFIKYYLQHLENLVMNTTSFKFLYSHLFS